MGNSFDKKATDLRIIQQNMHDLIEKHETILGQYEKKDNQCEQITVSDKKEKLECFIFGYIRELVEDKYDLMIPYYLKIECLLFYGNIIMNSNILNTNQVNIIGYTLKSKLDQKINSFYPQKICDSFNDGFDVKIFNEKYQNFDGTMIIIKTNQNDILS